MSLDENNNNEEEEVETNQRVKFEYNDNLYPEQLEPHPVNITLYGEEDVNKDKNILTLVESIRRKGLLEPLVIKKEETEGEEKEKYIIISGHRRWRALKYINENKLDRIIVDDKKDDEIHTEFRRRKAKCQIVSFRNELEEKKAIVEYNRRRKKRYSQLYNEIEMLHEIYDSDALKRSRSNLRNSLPNDAQTIVNKLKAALKRGDFAEIDLEFKDIDWSLSPEELAFEYGHLIDGRMDDDYFSDYHEIELGRTVDKIVKELGQKSSTVKKLTKVGRFAYDHHDETAIKAMKYLDQGIISITGAEIIVKLRNRYLLRKEPGAIIAKRLYEEIEDGIQKKIKGEKGERLTPAIAMRRFKELVPNYDPEPAHQEQPYSIEPVYSVVYIIPVLSNEFQEDFEPNIRDLESDIMPDYLANVSIPAAKDAALYLITTRRNIKHCINMFKIWDFKIQTFTLILRDHGYGVLLFGTKGNWAIPDGENQIQYDTILDFEKIPDHIRRIYSEIDSFYQISSNDIQPEGWGKPFKEVKPEPPEDIENNDENESEETSKDTNKDSGNEDGENEEHNENKKNDNKKSHRKGPASNSWL